MAQAGTARMLCYLASVGGNSCSVSSLKFALPPEDNKPYSAYPASAKRLVADKTPLTPANFRLLTRRTPAFLRLIPRLAHARPLQNQTRTPVSRSRAWARMDERGDTASPRRAWRWCDRLAMHRLRLNGQTTGELRDPEESHPCPSERIPVRTAGRGRTRPARGPARWTGSSPCSCARARDRGSASTRG